MRSKLTRDAQRPTVIVGLTLQQAIAMFVLKSGAGFSIFKWIAFLASDFLAQALEGAAFFFSTDVVNNHWFFVNTVCLYPCALSAASILTPAAF